MRTHESYNIKKIGFFMLTMLGFLMFFIINLSTENSWFDRKVLLKAKLSDADGLREGGVVRFKGMTIGSVDKMLITDDINVELILAIQSSFMKYIKTDSVVEVNSKGLVGDKILIIHPGSIDSANLNEGDTLSAKKAISPESFLESGKNITDRLEILLKELAHRVDAIKPDTLHSTMGHLEKASLHFANITKQLDQTRTSEKLSKTLDEFNKIAKRINEGPGTLHSLIYDDGLYNQAEEFMGGAKRNRVLKYIIRKSLDDNEEKK